MGDGVVKVVIGRTAVWCVDGETAERAVDALTPPPCGDWCARGA